MVVQVAPQTPVEAVGRREASMLLIIPAYNEQLCIGEVVRKARQTLPPEADILVIDDGSRDRTAVEARQAGAFVVSHPFNLGIGGAMQTGLKFALRGNYDLVLRIDGDGQHDPNSLFALLRAVQLGKADVAIGSRFLDGKAEMKIPLIRQIGIRMFAGTVSLITGSRATDTTSGLIVMNRRAADLLAAYMPQDYPEVEMRVLLHSAGLIAREVPVQMGERIAGVSSITPWRSVYYAMKVSVAVLLTAMKRTPKCSWEMPHAHRTTTHGTAA